MTGIEFKSVKPIVQLSDFVESFWMLSNTSKNKKEIVVMPDGRIDLSVSSIEPQRPILLGIESEPSNAILLPETTIFAVSFKLLAIDYFFNGYFNKLVNAVYQMPGDYFAITGQDFPDFTKLCAKATKKIVSLLPKEVDERKRRLFELIYSSRGDITIKKISGLLNWSPRQINRYFNQNFGISLKAYCNILKFRASFGHIKEGRLSPEQNFTDQAHFIKHIKKYSGVTPKELSKNTNDRFIQFSFLPKT